MSFRAAIIEPESMESHNLSGTPGTTRKSPRFILPVIIVIVVLALVVSGYSWYSAQVACNVNAVKDASARLVRQRNSYDHSYQFATSVSRNAIVRPVNELQQILMDTQDVPVPACMRTVKEELISYMDIVIRAFLTYGAQESDAAVRDLINQSNVHYRNFSIELDAVNECAPMCIP